MEMNKDPYNLLSGVKIIELTTYVAAPSAGRILADWGADIIKVESVPKGDTTRFAAPLPGMKKIAYDFHNANKRSIALNLKSEEGQEIMAKLLKEADVFITNTRGKSLAKLGMDYDTLSAKYPRLIHAHLTGFGEIGPMADNPGFDNVSYWALSGAMIAAMEKDTAPIIPPSTFGDHSTACTLAGAICAALYKQLNTGEGSKIVVSLYGQALYSMTEPFISIQCSDLDKYPKSRLETTPLSNTYKCKDKNWIMVSCHEYDRYWPSFMKVIGREDLIDNPEYNTFDKGFENSREVIQILSDGFKKLTRDEASKLLTENDIPHSIISNVEEVLDSVQAKENLYFHEFIQPNGDKFLESATPAKFGGVTLPKRQRAPFLGEQSTKILTKLGYDEEQIEKFKGEGIVIEKHVHAELEK
jgi:crotonobetainyl-CoA:carnitine CoA-transferase CaiB-like acyl-CoA transferase